MQVPGVPASCAGTCAGTCAVPVEHLVGVARGAHTMARITVKDRTNTISVPGKANADPVLWQHWHRAWFLLYDGRFEAQRVLETPFLFGVPTSAQTAGPCAQYR